MRKQNGFTLLVVLVFLQIFSLLGLYALRSKATLLKNTRYEWQQQALLMQAKLAMHLAEAKLQIQNPTCLIAVTSAEQMLAQPLTWWRQYACRFSLERTQFYYVVEFLGNDGCGVVSKNDNNQSITADYYRITLISTSNLRLVQIKLQATEVKSSFAISSCSGKLHSISEGRQTLRELMGT